MVNEFEPLENGLGHFDESNHGQRDACYHDQHRDAQKYPIIFGLSHRLREMAFQEPIVAAIRFEGNIEQVADEWNRARDGFAAHASRFLSADLVECFGHFRHDVKAVVDMQGLGALLAEDLAVGLHMSEQTNTMLETISSPIVVKSPWKESRFVLCAPRADGLCRDRS